MALKRKLSQDFDDEAYVAVRPTAKKVQVVFYTELFPTSDSDMDVDMSEASAPTLTPLNIPDHPFHTRLTSTSSTGSDSDSPNTSPSYPTFDLYPHDPHSMSIDTADYYDHAAGSSPRMVGLMQPKGSSFTHHGQSCAQIPKLRMACSSSGLQGQRTMWAHCEECGAIEMVETD